MDAFDKPDPNNGCEGDYLIISYTCDRYSSIVQKQTSFYHFYYNCYITRTLRVNRALGLVLEKTIEIKLQLPWVKLIGLELV